MYKQFHIKKEKCLNLSSANPLPSYMQEQEVGQASGSLRKDCRIRKNSSRFILYWAKTEGLSRSPCPLSSQSEVVSTQGICSPD